MRRWEVKGREAKQRGVVTMLCRGNGLSKGRTAAKFKRPL